MNTNISSTKTTMNKTEENTNSHGNREREQGCQKSRLRLLSLLHFTSKHYDWAAQTLIRFKCRL